MAHQQTVVSLIAGYLIGEPHVEQNGFIVLVLCDREINVIRSVHRVFETGVLHRKLYNRIISHARVFSRVHHSRQAKSAQDENVRSPRRSKAVRANRNRSEPHNRDEKSGSQSRSNTLPEHQWTSMPPESLTGLAAEGLLLSGCFDPADAVRSSNEIFH